MSIKVETFCDQVENANTYLISNDFECIVIDPANNISILKKFIGSKKLLGIFLTHGHYDHFKNISELLELKPKVYLHYNAYRKLQNPFASCAMMFQNDAKILLDDADVTFISKNCKIILGNFDIETCFLPGHTNCSIGYLIEKNLFCGDVIFEDSVGRWDLPTGNYNDLISSLTKIIHFSDDTTIYPGHGNNFVLKDAKKSNYYLRNLK